MWLCWSLRVCVCVCLAVCMCACRYVKIECVRLSLCVHTGMCVCVHACSRECVCLCVVVCVCQTCVLRAVQRGQDLQLGELRGAGQELLCLHQRAVFSAHAVYSQQNISRMQSSTSDHTHADTRNRQKVWSKESRKQQKRMAICVCAEWRIKWEWASAVFSD